MHLLLSMLNCRVSKVSKEASEAQALKGELSMTVGQGVRWFKAIKVAWFKAVGSAVRVTRLPVAPDKAASEGTTSV